MAPTKLATSTQAHTAQSLDMKSTGNLLQIDTLVTRYQLSGKLIKTLPKETFIKAPPTTTHALGQQKTSSRMRAQVLRMDTTCCGRPIENESTPWQLRTGRNMQLCPDSKSKSEKSNISARSALAHSLLLCPTPCNC